MAPGVVTKVTSPLSYWVQTANGIIMKRHTNQLLSRNITLLDNSSDTDHIDKSDECDDFSTIDLPTPILREPFPPCGSTRPRTHRDI